MRENGWGNKTGDYWQMMKSWIKKKTKTSLICKDGKEGKGIKRDSGTRIDRTY